MGEPKSMWLERMEKETEFNRFVFKKDEVISLAFNLKEEDFNRLIEQAKILGKIERVMGLSHADCFNKEDAIREIEDILGYY